MDFESGIVIVPQRRIHCNLITVGPMLPLILPRQIPARLARRGGNLLARLGGNPRTTRLYGEEGSSVREGQEGWGLSMGR
jgi:hypothetical protein